MDINKTIESGTAFFRGDPSVGIQPSSFDFQVFINLGCVSSDHREEYLTEVRELFTEAYEHMYGEPPTILFDFEIERMNQE